MCFSGSKNKLEPNFEKHQADRGGRYKIGVFYLNIFIKRSRNVKATVG